MKRILPFFFAAFLFTSANISGQDKGFGLGIMIGEPTGLSAKYWLGAENALDFGLAYSFIRKKSALSLHADYLFHNYDLIKSAERFPVYYGFGGRLHAVSGGSAWLGARGVAGIAWLSRELPIDVFLEVAPIFNILPETSLHFDVALGARYYFQ
jgi:hypothetical protein